ncbi:TlpA disulfide reductase family protein [Pedobacter gandavensis]|uniref:TlpA disulfide reductase family protein n=1 Tax=Pedobacter gandavensis TaxID=2679963 RepID=UPI00292CE8B9|nr:TlpA disulfide reductase family protein [Pedobacter gandavensis]
MNNTLKISTLSLGLVTLLNIAGVNAQQAKGFTIKGELTGVKDGDKILFIRSTAQNTSDTLSQTIKGGKFVLKGVIKNGAEFFSIRMEDKRLRYNAFLDNSNMTLKANANDFTESVITGSVSHEEHLKYSAAMNPLSTTMRALNKEYSDAKKAGQTDKLVTISQQFDELEGEQSKLTANFIKNNPDSYYTPYLIVKGDVEPSTTLPLYNALSASVKKSTYGLQLKDRLDALAKVAIGVKAPNFSAQTPEGTTLSLDEVVAKGKYTLIDFWASWCGPCRQENPNLVAAYEKFHDKGLNVLGVSLDKPTAAAAWKKAIADDKLNWYQISDLQYWQSPMVKLYAVRGIPHSVLVDAKGIIVAKDLRGKALHDKLAELMK